jgi:hypothetical protein
MNRNALLGDTIIEDELIVVMYRCLARYKEMRELCGDKGFWDTVAPAPLVAIQSLVNQELQTV